MKLSRFLAFVSLALVAALFSGCATFNRIADYPAPNMPVQVAVVAKPMSKMKELPMGGYYDEERQIIVTGHQKGLFLGMMFGVVGVVVADQANKSSGTSKYGDETAQAMTDLVALANEALANAMAENRAPQWALAANAGDLRLSPYAIFTVEKSGAARLYAMLRAETLGNDGKPTWSARYFARAPGEFTLDGADGWMAQDRFSTGIRSALDRALAVCIDDTHGRLNDSSKITAKGRFAYLNKEFELRAVVVQETPDFVVARLVVGDAMVLAGTHILDRADYSSANADFKDPRR